MPDSLPPYYSQMTQMRDDRNDQRFNELNKKIDNLEDKLEEIFNLLRTKSDDTGLIDRVAILEKKTKTLTTALVVVVSALVATGALTYLDLGSVALGFLALL